MLIVSSQTMIESYYWKEDLLNFAKQFKPVSKPPRWSERVQVNFEKDVTISFFMIRKLIESKRFSTKITDYKAEIFRSACVGKVNNMNFWDIDELYDLNNEKSVSKNINFVCNQLIHGGAMFAYREKDRNWGGIYTCSDFERNKYVYRIPLEEIIKIMKIAGNDYVEKVTMTYNEDRGDYDIITN